MSGDLHTRLANLPGFPVLPGQRLRLRGPRDEDVDDVFALFSDPAVMRYWTSAPMRCRTQAEGKLGEMREAFEHRDMLHWLVADRRHDRVIGSCSLFRFDPRARRAEVGYALRSNHWGRGLATEAVGLALDWGFRACSLERIEADIDRRNEASRRLLLRLGFRQAQPPRQRFLLGETVAETDVFTLSAQDWRLRRR